MSRASGTPNVIKDGIPFIKSHSGLQTLPYQEHLKIIRTSIRSFF